MKENASPDRLFREALIKYIEETAKDLNPKPPQTAKKLDQWYWFDCLDQPPKNPDFRLLYYPNSQEAQRLGSDGLALLRFELYQLADKDYIKREIEPRIDKLKTSETSQIKLYLNDGEKSFGISMKVDAPFVKNPGALPANQEGINNSIKAHKAEIDKIVSSLRRLKEWFFENRDALTIIRENVLSGGVNHDRFKNINYPLLHEIIMKTYSPNENICPKKNEAIKSKYEQKTGKSITIEEVEIVVSHTIN
jgi:hypothetical protein